MPVRVLVIVALTLCASAWPQAQPADVAATLRARIDAIQSDRGFDVPRFGPARWLPGQPAYTTVERSATAGTGSDIVRYDAATGERQVLVAASRLTPPGAASGLDIADYAWSPDGARLLIFSNTRKVWRDNTRGDYWMLDLRSDGRLRKLGGDGPEASLLFAKFSPDSRRVGYVRANDIWVEDIATGRITRLTRDGSATTINGTSDWVYEEELGVRDAFRWSPDSRAIAYWQFDTTGVGIFMLANDTHTLYPALTRIPYPKTGTTNSAVRIGVVSSTGGATRWMDVPGDPREHYLARVSWLDGRSLAVQQLNRLQNRHDLLVADSRSGGVRLLFREETTTWIDIDEEVRWIDGGRAFLWVSERDGWRHVFRVSGEGGEPTLVTRFDADIVRVTGLDEAEGWLYFTASPDRATQSYLYRSRLDGTGTPERVTPAAADGYHSYQVAPDGRHAFHTVSRFDQPPAIDLVELPSHRSRRALTDVSAVTRKLASVVTQPTEFFTLDIGDGVTLDGWLVKPRDFDAHKRYPLIVYVYGEPAAQTVTDAWSRRQLFHRALADAGYLVASFDNRGTPAPKGAAWRKVVYGTVGELSSREQARAVQALAAARPYVDATRVGIWGHSGGGSNTLNALFRYPDVFHVGVSLAPVPDQTLYDTIYQERYMGTPQGNPDGYRRGSPIHFAEGLRGKLLVVHGSGDDNVHYQGTQRLIDRLVALGKPFEMMVYPNRTHAIVEGEGTVAHVNNLVGRYFVEHLPPGGRE
ncbi:MAG TPA: S9 family peptidase [Luteitalea sp.]|nr:S9 family peptidase [Luteitalea sp.]